MPLIIASFHSIVSKIFTLLMCIIWYRITSTVKASGGLRAKLFYVAYNAKKQALEKGDTLVQL